MNNLKQLAWYVLAGTRGSPNRVKIVLALRERPYNANQLAELLGLDYKTVRHHLQVLVENNIVTLAGKPDSYAAPWVLSDFMEHNFEYFTGIWAGSGKTGIRSTFRLRTGSPI